MSTDLERMVRLALAEEAAHAPDGSSLLAALHGRRRRKAHRSLAQVAVVALTAVVVLGAGLLGQHVGERSGLPTAGGRSVNGLVPVPPNWLPAFPLTPGWLPAGLGPPHTGYSSHEQVSSVSYTDPRDRTRPPGTVRGVSIATSSQRLTPVQRRVRRSILVGGRPVMAYAGPIAYDNGQPRGFGAEVAWERRPGQWVVVICDSTLGTFDNLRRVAESLQDVPVTPTRYLQLAGLPPGLTSLGGYGPAELLLLPDGEREQNQVPEERSVSVQLQRNVEPQVIPRLGVPPPGQQALIVKGRPAWYTVGGQRHELRIWVKGDTVLFVRAPAGLPKSVVLEFAAGITVLPSAQAMDVGP